MTASVFVIGATRGLCGRGGRRRDLGHGLPVFPSPRTAEFPETCGGVCATVPREARNQQCRYVLDRHQLVGHVALPHHLASLVPPTAALTTVLRARFDYSGLGAQWSWHIVVYELFGQAVARLQDRFARERVFPLEQGRVYYLPFEAFSTAKPSLAPGTTGSLTLLLTVLNPLNFRCTPSRRWCHPAIPPPRRGFARAQESTNGNRRLSQIVALASLPFLRLPRRNHIGLLLVSSPRLQCRFSDHLVPQAPSLPWCLRHNGSCMGCSKRTVAGG